MFNFFRNFVSSVSESLSSLFSKNNLCEQDIQHIKSILLAADIGVRTTEQLTQSLLLCKTGAQAREQLAHELTKILGEYSFVELRPIILMVGINGGGKTTALAKLANLQRISGKKVLLAAADTFRAAAVQQLEQWARTIGCDIVSGAQGQDPAAVVYRACEQFKSGNYDSLLIDTAGRLQTKTALMGELSKIKRVITKVCGEQGVTTLLVLDAMLGQNSIEQARVFNEATKIDGIILTKTDASAKGGALVSIVQELHVPIAYVTFGEQKEQIKKFDAQVYVDALLN